jgi:F-type H+-transporting ATPase subunit epsilon
MQLEIITPEKVVLQQDIDEVIVPTPNGQIAILPHHVSLVTKVQPGELIIKVKGKETFLAITGGFLEIANNKITILADYAVRAEEIEVEKVLAAQKRAEDVLKKTKENISERDLAIAQAELQRSILQLHVVNKRKRRSG